MDELVKPFIAPLVEIWQRFANAAPDIITALVFLLVGLILARVISTIAEKFLRKINLDNFTAKIGINEIFTRVGFGKSPSYAVGFALYWSVVLVFILLATNALGLAALSAILQRFMGFVPRLVMAVLTLFGGLLFAPFLRNVVANSAAANNLKGGPTLARIVEGVVIFFAALIALEQLGIEMRLINSAVEIALAAMGLAFALAVGLGAKDLVAEYLRNLFKSE